MSRTPPSTRRSSSTRRRPCRRAASTRARRATWVYIRNDAGNGYVYGFCALGTPASLNDIWFARPQGAAPAAVYVELVDRQTGRVYSNSISTVP